MSSALEAAVPGVTRRLRFGVTRSCAWEAHRIRALLAVEGVELALLLVQHDGQWWMFHGVEGRKGDVRDTRLSRTEFAEETAAVVHADPGGPYPDAVHTLSRLGDKTLIDGQHALFVPALFLSQLGKLAGRVFGR